MMSSSIEWSSSRHIENKKIKEVEKRGGAWRRLRRGRVWGE
jgi:hypothetical protein